MLNLTALLLFLHWYLTYWTARGQVQASLTKQKPQILKTTQLTNIHSLANQNSVREMAEQKVYYIL